MLDIQDLYQQRVSKYADRFIKVVLTSFELHNIDVLAASIVEAKQHETTHKKDGASELKRFVNGLKGETAVSKYLSIPVVEAKAGVSIDFDHPDIIGYNLGVKTVEYGHFPVIPKENTYPQIICICHPNDNSVVYICGLADVDTLNKYQFDDLILDINLRNKGTKTGFYGFSELKEISKDILEPLRKEDDIDG